MVNWILQAWPHLHIPSANEVIEGDRGTLNLLKKLSRILLTSVVLLTRYMAHLAAREAKKVFELDFSVLTNTGPFEEKKTRINMY